MKHKYTKETGLQFLCENCGNYMYIDTILLDFLKWIQKVSKDEPMRLETDNDDIVMMFIEEYKNT